MHWDSALPFWGITFVFRTLCSLPTTFTQLLLPSQLFTLSILISIYTAINLLLGNLPQVLLGSSSTWTLGTTFPFPPGPILLLLPCAAVDQSCQVTSVHMYLGIRRRRLVKCCEDDDPWQYCTLDAPLTAYFSPSAFHLLESLSLPTGLSTSCFLVIRS